MSDLPTVRSADSMDDETFVKHINARHMPIGGMSKARQAFEGESLLRAYHDRLHREAPNHNHGPRRPE